ncbi:MAG TPA: ABC transporter substrate-binding protein [Acetobacteraceae bacterium]|jgi:phospholipid transport system substrate-binding protein
MLTRRALLATAITLASLPVLPIPGMAQTSDPAGMFVDKLLHDLTAIVNSNGPMAPKQMALAKIVDRDVDINDVARFCLGRFWRTATPDQQRDYTTLFHTVLMKNITGKVGDYQGVTFTVGRSQQREGATVVSSEVTRPGNPPNKVDWLISSSSGGPKIIDVIAEGTSLRVTQRSDYASYLSRNNDNVQALINAMRQQISQPG